MGQELQAVRGLFVKVSGDLPWYPGRGYLKLQAAAPALTAEPSAGSRKKEHADISGCGSYHPVLK
jgi:hypothetical protein